MERGETAIVTAQFVALFAVVIVLSGLTPSQSSQSNPSLGSVYWGAAGQGIPLKANHVTRVTTNETTIVAEFAVAESTHPSAVTASRLCVAPNATSGESTTYGTIQFKRAANGDYSMVIGPTAQQPGWVCTYTIKVTDSLSQTSTWLGTVEFAPTG